MTKKPKKASGKSKTATRKSTAIKKSVRSVPEIDLETDLDRLEFHRLAFALMPRRGDRKPGVAVMAAAEGARFAFRGCSCNRFSRKVCPHILELERLLEEAEKKIGGLHFDDKFGASLWFRLAKIFSEPSRAKPDETRFEEQTLAGKSVLCFFDDKDRELLTYISDDRHRDRFLERIDLLSEGRTISRGDALDRLVTAALSDNERELMRCGMRSRGLVFVESFWYRFFYHAYREFGTGGFSFVPDVCKNTGDYRLIVKKNGGETLFRLVVPRSAVKTVLQDAALPVSEKKGFAIDERPAEPILEVKRDAVGCIRIYPRMRFVKSDGDIVYYDTEKISKYRFGDLLHLPGEKMFVPVAKTGSTLKEIGYPKKRVVKKKDVPAFLSEYGDFLRNGDHLLDSSAAGLRVFTESDGLEISAESLGRKWCWISVRYGFGSDTISLAELLEARKKGERFIATSEGWVDSEAQELDALSLLQDVDLAAEARPEDDSEEQGSLAADRLRLSRMDLFRLQASARKDPRFSGDDEKADLMRKFFELRPDTHPPDIGDTLSPLRGYQARGAEWLWFLYENGLGGLLCDDMGLGKTHQVMALMQFLRRKNQTPFLVVCPTTVMGHWEKKLKEHATGLSFESYHGGDRDLLKSIENCHVLITSYGIVLRDAEALARIPFKLCVFDEIQNIKNPDTKTYKAARKIEADMKVGLTGTPIENSIRELKALMDVTTPGYLGDKATFERRYAIPLENNPNLSVGAELSRLISPFTLRRRKSTVLQELPEKIEDIMTCSLSDDQVRLYREAIESRQKGVIANLKNESADIPYIHIFALLTLLKQICDHPALVNKRPEEYARFESGKWELFKELLDESLDSGQKVVVYSQFVQMIEIVKRHLEEKKVGAAILTGQSRNRSEIINRFNDDPDCRVFVGSLKAGGTGIDLVAASVVIHYDRWWNAAREDQATDRVHRIGQRRGVQVFKLVTQGTLEEKISAIIERKRNLMDSVVREDDPGLLKTFTRSELLEMVSMPGMTFPDAERSENLPAQDLGTNLTT